MSRQASSPPPPGPPRSTSAAPRQLDARRPSARTRLDGSRNAADICLPLSSYYLIILTIYL